LTSLLAATGSPVTNFKSFSSSCYHRESTEKPSVRSMIPDWFRIEFLENEKNQKKLFDFDFKLYDEPFIKSFPDTVEGIASQKVTADKTMFHLRPELLSEADLHKLSFVPRGKSKEYICVGEAYYFPLFRDLPVHYTPSSPSLLYIEMPDKTGKEQTPKILYQLAPFVPPMFWIPLKPNTESLGRLFEELMDIESNNVSRHLEYHENLLSQIGFNVDQLKELDANSKASEKQYSDLHVRFLDYINKTLDPNKLDFKERVLQEYPNSVSLFLGNVSSLQDLESSFMNNPFVFSTPIVLGSTNRFLANEVVQTSMFHTVFSRSLIVLEARLDLHIDFASSSSDRLIPVFARIYYPSNQRLSKPCTERMNKVFDSNFPADLPVDVCLALFGQKNHNAESIAKELFDIIAKDEELIKNGVIDKDDHNNIFNPCIPIAHLAVLRYDKWPTEIFEKFRNHPLPIVRMSIVKGCIEFFMLDQLKALEKTEKHEEVLQFIKEAISRLEKKIEFAKERELADEQERQRRKEAEEKKIAEIEKENAN